MKPRLPTGSAEALEPVRAALLARARADADAALDAARDEAARLRAAAHDQAGRILASGRAEGEREAREAVAAQLARHRRQARDIVLAARRDLYDELRRRCREVAGGLRADREYALLRRHLTRRAVATLGPEASIQEGTGGGVVAVAGSRRLDLTLPTLAEREVDRLGEEVRRLWDG